MYIIHSFKGSHVLLEMFVEREAVASTSVENTFIVAGNDFLDSSE